MAFCTSCGIRLEIEEAANFCTGCGSPLRAGAASRPQASYPAGYLPKSRLTALLLLIFLGYFGAHRFYAGRVGSGIAMLAIALFSGLSYTTWFALSFMLFWDASWLLPSYTALIAGAIIGYIGLFVWWIIDLVRICAGTFADRRGYPLKKD